MSRRYHLEDARRWRDNGALSKELIELPMMLWVRIVVGSRIINLPIYPRGTETAVCNGNSVFINDNASAHWARLIIQYLESIRNTALYGMAITITQLESHIETKRRLYIHSMFLIGTISS
ncbi:hypothetical protein CEXT_440051 [Caerostris extrusa]|uniref:Uncharacterized protein n=1 Tax=Caerostris extrusa TaxID=172846 RepID=A0AAV4S8I1_CAEEX|nr:hypothetical protein CEXT_440051 [Caerostris extrusa]